MSEQEPISPRRRMQMLLAIPDSERTDEEWDELNELEISLAPGNRIDGPDPNARKAAPGRVRPQQPRQGQPRQPRQQKPPKAPGPTSAPAADGNAAAEQPAGGAPKKPFRRSPRRAARGNAPKGNPPAA